MKILMVLTFHDQPMGNSRRAGLWLEEFAAPYYVFADAGAVIALASRAGGKPPLEPESEDLAAQTEATRRLAADPAASAALAHTARLGDLHTSDYDALFYPSGHGRPRDLNTDPASIALIGETRVAGRAADTAYQGPVVFSHARAHDGTPLVSRRGLTGSGGGEAAERLVGAVPFLAADASRSGAVFQTGPDWQPFVLVDGTLGYGQHPASSEATARALLRVLEATADARQGNNRLRPFDPPAAASAGSVDIR